MNATIVNKTRAVARDPLGAMRRSVGRGVEQVNQRFKRAAGGDARPAFYDIDTTCPAFRLLDRSYPVIRDELESILSYKDRIPRYHDLDKNETYISGTQDPDKNWRVFMLRTTAGTPVQNQARCPRTTAVLAQIPNLYQAFFSILDAGKSIPAHSGVYFGYLRYHLGLRVPRNNPPRMRVKDQWHTWEEGRSILFDDSWNHEVVNQSDDLRVVLIVDVLRPLPRALHVANRVFTRVLFKHSEEARQVMANITKYSR
jgi:aspartyl/asparaginyl beta-hydroxylase (cupin superfamily)